MHIMMLISPLSLSRMISLREYLFNKRVLDLDDPMISLIRHWRHLVEFWW